MQFTDQTKIIGTLLPLFALKSSVNSSSTTGKIADSFPFLDWLEKTGQHAWQMLPIHETQLIHGSVTEHNRSPYKGYGVGINPRYGSADDLPEAQQLEYFISTNAYWLSDYALFCALRNNFGTDNWTRWDEDISIRKPAALQYWKEKLSPEINIINIEQYRLHKEYARLKKYATDKKINLIGDMQFYLPLKSPLVWAYHQCFLINDDGTLPRVSGIPYIPGAMYGRQVWGHPVYNWQNAKVNEDILSLFLLRLRYLSSLFDMVRIDHAVGLFHYGSMNPHNQKEDVTLKGPGSKAFRKIVTYAATVNLKILAEDLGPELKELRMSMHKLSVPGVRVLRYAYDEENNTFLKDHQDIGHYPHLSVAYTTTHDTETVIGFLRKLNPKQKQIFSDKTGIEITSDLKISAKNVIKTVLESQSMIAILPLQDWLLSEERINTPGTENEQNDPNWRYRIPVPAEELPLQLITYNL